MICEKCWGDAWGRVICDSSKTISQHYLDLLEERKNRPCTSQQQAGQFWDEQKQIDTRTLSDHQEKL